MHSFLILTCFVTALTAVIINNEHLYCEVPSNATASDIHQVCDCDRYQCYRKCCPDSNHVYYIVNFTAVLVCDERAQSGQKNATFVDRINHLFDHNERNKTAFKVVRDLGCEKFRAANSESVIHLLEDGGLRTIPNDEEEHREEGQIVKIFDELYDISEYCLEIMYDPLTHQEWLEPFACFPNADEVQDTTFYYNSIGTY